MRTQIGTYDAARETLDALGAGNVLLVTGKKGNPMTIGWGTIGRIWGKPVLTVLVRPSRYSFSLLEGLAQFTVNVMADTQKAAVALCGSKSGRDIDKPAAAGLHLEPAQHIDVPYLAESTLHYECRVVHHTEVLNSTLASELVAGSYPSGDLHRIFHGEIVGVFRAG